MHAQRACPLIGTILQPRRASLAAAVLAAAAIIVLASLPAAADDVCAGVETVCRPFSSIYNTNRWCAALLTLLPLRCSCCAAAAALPPSSANNLLRQHPTQATPALRARCVQAAHAAHLVCRTLAPTECAARGSVTRALEWPRSTIIVDQYGLSCEEVGYHSLGGVPLDSNGRCANLSWTAPRAPVRAARRAAAQTLPATTAPAC